MTKQRPRAPCSDGPFVGAPASAGGWSVALRSARTSASTAPLAASATFAARPCAATRSCAHEAVRALRPVCAEAAWALPLPWPLLRPATWLPLKRASALSPASHGALEQRQQELLRRRRASALTTAAAREETALAAAAAARIAGALHAAERRRMVRCQTTACGVQPQEYAIGGSRPAGAPMPRRLTTRPRGASAAAREDGGGAAAPQ